MLNRDCSLRWSGLLHTPSILLTMLAELGKSDIRSANLIARVRLYNDAGQLVGGRASFDRSVNITRCELQNRVCDFNAS